MSQWFAELPNRLPYSCNLLPIVPGKIHYLVAIRIGISKMAVGDEYLDYLIETLERMAKCWSTFVRGVHKLMKWQLLNSLLKLTAV